MAKWPNNKKVSHLKLHKSKRYYVQCLNEGTFAKCWLNASLKTATAALQLCAKVIGFAIVHLSCSAEERPPPAFSANVFNVFFATLRSSSIYSNKSTASAIMPYLLSVLTTIWDELELWERGTKSLIVFSPQLRESRDVYCLLSIGKLDQHSLTLFFIMIITIRSLRWPLHQSEAIP